jgi:hypothetical protein
MLLISPITILAQQDDQVEGVNSGSTEWVQRGVILFVPDYVDYVGLTLQEAYEILGVPEEVFPFRGAEVWQDNVVFYYNNHIYLFWYGNRVWQVRLDKRYEGNLGPRGDPEIFFMGMERGLVRALLGEPFAEDEVSSIYLLPDQGYPVRLRLFFESGVLTDLYLYRGDF